MCKHLVNQNHLVEADTALSLSSKRSSNCLSSVLKALSQHPNMTQMWYLVSVTVVLIELSIPESILLSLGTEFGNQNF